MSERIIKLDLDDVTYDALVRKAGCVNITVTELLQNFIGDLTGEQYYNGSDESDFVDAWFDRCRFINDEYTFLSYLNDYDLLNKFIETVKDYKNTKESYEITKMKLEQNKDTDYWKQLVSLKGTGKNQPAYKSYEEWYKDEISYLSEEEFEMKCILENLKEYFDEYKKDCPNTGIFEEKTETEKIVRWYRLHYPNAE